MKRVLSYLLAVILCFSTTVALANEAKSTQEPEATQESTIEYDFKKFNWGDPMSKIVDVEGEPEFDGDFEGYKNAKYIAYDARVAGYDMALGYYFCDDGLFQTRYVSMESHSNDSLYINDYEDFKSILIKKYGESLLDKENWENDSKKKYYADDKGNALSYGYLTYETIWIMDRTYIYMTLSADNYDVSMTIDYSSLTIYPEEDDYSDDI